MHVKIVSLIFALLLTSIPSYTISAPNEALSIQTYMDYNHDNMFDPTNEIVFGINVFLIRQTEDFAAVRVLQTNEYGIADFSNVEKGQYLIDACGNSETHIVYTDDNLGTLILFNCLHRQVFMPIGMKSQ